MLHRRLTYACRFDSSVGRGAFVTKIGVGQVIKGALTLLHIRCGILGQIAETIQQVGMRVLLP